MAVTTACRILGLARSTFYRITRSYAHYRPVPNPVPHTGRYQPAALTSAERGDIVSVLSRDDYEELSVVQAYWRAFDERLVACSQRTFYRIAQAEAMVGDRRPVRPGTGTAPSRRKPIAAACKPGDLWSWDVTELRGPRSQDRYKLYLVIDVFSRYPVAWRIEHNEDRQFAVDMFTDAIRQWGAPKVVHADNGGVMRSRLLINALDDRGVLTSYSRARVSDDNPFSESLFKTIKYDPCWPGVFDTIDHARNWTRDYLHRYATQHRHSGLGWHTPAAVHNGTAIEVQRQRQENLDQYWTKNPRRFRRRPTAPELPKPTGINTHQLSQTD
nr:IS3 family transposase [Hoyosella altamirensis]